MPRFIEGLDRQQVTLLPECPDDFVAEDNPVRVVEDFVAELDVGKPGFQGTVPAETGRPPYDPALLLRIYLYGYLNRIQSTRRLERECQRNVELMWLTRRLAPDFKSIADFRRDHSGGIRNVCSQFVLVCRKLKLLSDGVVAEDGSKFKAVNNRDRNYTPHKLEQRIKQVQDSIDRYLQALDTADRTQPEDLPAKTERIREKLAKLRQQMSELRQVQQELPRQRDQQLSLTDPDARSMATSGRGTGMVGYNVQIAADIHHHLIVAHEVTNVGRDREALAPMTDKTQRALGRKQIGVLADRGYYNDPQIRQCEQSGADTFVPKPQTSGAKFKGRLHKGDIIYIARDDEYRCPAGERAIYRFTSVDKGLRMHRYWSSACPKCAMKARCTPSDYRRIVRWEHEDVLDKMQRRLDRNPDAMRIRRRTVEHVFGTLKHWMGSTHFLARRLVNVGTEMSLQVLAYSLKRLMSIIGIAGTMKAMRLAGA